MSLPLRLTAACTIFLLTLSACDSIDSGLEAGRESPVAHEGSLGTISYSKKGTSKDLRPSSQKYKDTSLQAASVSSGSITLTTRALRGSDGMTTLEITTGALDTDPSQAPGTITQVEVNLLDPNNPKRALWRKTYRKLSGGGYVSYAYSGAARGMQFEVTATVANIDPKPATLTTIETVKLRPDLIVSDLILPEQASNHLPVSFYATVREGNGDVGGWANCVLYIDDVLTDSGWNIWVNAGDVVTCAFTQYFYTVGTKQIHVALENVVPGDYNTANNSMVGALKVVLPTQFGYSAEAGYDVEPFVFKETYEYSFTSGDGKASSLSQRAYDNQGQIQWGMLSAWIPRKIDSSNLSILLSQSSGGAVLHTFKADQLQPTSWWGDEYYGGWCYETTDQSTAGNLNIAICSSGWSGEDGSAGSTTVSYSRRAGSVTYHSRFYQKFFDERDGNTGESLYEQNIASAWGGTFLPYGDSFAFNLLMSEGDAVMTTEAAFPLYLNERNDSHPYSCLEWGDESTGDRYKECWGHEYREKRLIGWGYAGAQ